VRALAEELRTPGLALYASRLGRAAAFAVYEDEALCWGLAEGGRILYRYCEGVEGEPRTDGRLPDDLDAAAVAAAQAGEPKTAAARALAGMLGLFPDHAVVGFGDLLELDEASELPEDVWIFEDDAGPELRLERPVLEDEHAGG